MKKLLKILARILGYPLWITVHNSRVDTPRVRVFYITSANYKKKLTDPKWKKKSKWIKKRDYYTCNVCGNKQGLLNVHHIIYTTPDPWNEDDWNLITLCIDCHQSVHDYQNDTGLNFYTNERMD